jgi:rhodanese-related sulfurtransferase
VTARQAHAVLQANSDVLLIDVRTPAEVLFSGIATAAARNIPYLMIEEGYAYDPPARRYKLTANADFPKSIALLLEERKLASQATMILYCSVGERSAKAAALLAASGYSRVYTMVDGFDGDATGDGWKRSGLPWTYEMTEEQAYHSPTM